MKNSSSSGITVATLPTELTTIVTDCLCNKDVKNLSLVCRKLREISLSRIFRNVRFPFSSYGFSALRELLLSDMRYYVVSFTYKVPELLSSGKDLAPCASGITNDIIEMQNLNFFEENVLKAEEYNEIWKKDTDIDNLSENPVPYLLVFDTFKSICQEQLTIVENCEDLTSLSNAFKNLPQLRELGLIFCPTLKINGWIESYMDQTLSDTTVRHHLQVVSNALKAGKDCGILIHTIHVSDLALSSESSLWEDQDVQLLRNYLRDLLTYASVFRLSGSGSPLKVLASIDLDLRHLELCQLTVTQTVFLEFIQQKLDSIDFVRCHNVHLIGTNGDESSFVGLSSPCDNSHFSMIRVTASSCAICSKEG